MRSRTVILMSLVPLLLGAEAAAQPTFEFPIGALARGDGSAGGDAVVESIGLFDPPLINVSNDNDSLLAVNAITSIDHLFAAAQDSPLATAQLDAFCGAGSMARSQVDATDDWQVIGYPFLIRFFSTGQAKHDITDGGGCQQLVRHENRHLVFEEVDAPFLVNSAVPGATLVITAILSANHTPGSPMVPTIGSLSGTWEIWDDANRNHLIDWPDQRIARQKMNTGLGETIGPFIFRVPISTSGAFVARFRTQSRTSMTYRPPDVTVENPSARIGTTFATSIGLQ